MVILLITLTAVALHHRGRTDCSKAQTATVVGINASNSGLESWTGIGVVAGCAAVWLITQGPHEKDIAVYERITFLHILQEVRGIGKARNQLSER